MLRVVCTEWNGENMYVVVRLDVGILVEIWFDVMLKP